ncbi:alpha/beta hydrolase [Synechococcus sp. UW140]|uniref:alpha/beta hydrolase n=1 Tax=Synechococcus sp. UW140 TaxID=368503 RepID=UPI001FCAE8E0|nr:alpha/beta hydrolase [Synechococcus sp. UW140]
MNHSSKTRRRRLLALFTGVGVTLTGLGAIVSPPSQAAKDVALVSGAFRRSISVADLAYLAETGKPRGLMVDILRLSKQDPEDVAKLLNQELNLPLVLTSRLMSTRIGDVIIRRVARIIYPLMVPAPEVSVPAIRAGVINGLQIGDGGLTAIKFLEAYPAEVMEVNIPALMAVIEKAQSISGLVQFFSESPLDGLKDAQP